MGISAALGAHQQALGALIAVIGSREITAGIEPARRNGKVVGGSSIGLGSCGSGRIGGLPGGLGFPGCPPMSKLRSGLTLEKTPPHLLSSAHRRLRACRAAATAAQIWKASGIPPNLALGSSGKHQRCGARHLELSVTACCSVTKTAGYDHHPAARSEPRHLPLPGFSLGPTEGEIYPGGVTAPLPCVGEITRPDARRA